MKLYTYDPAPNPQRLALFLKAKGIGIDTQQIDLLAGEQHTDEYRAIVPEGTVPALVLDDGNVLREVIGICIYLEAALPGKPLLGTNPLEKAQIVSWCHKLWNMVFGAAAEALRNSSPNFANRALPGPLDVPQIPELVERGKKRLQWAWTDLDRTLEGREYLVGNQLSMADIDLLVCVGFAAWVKEKPPESCTNLNAYVARVQAELDS